MHILKTTILLLISGLAAPSLASPKTEISSDFIDETVAGCLSVFDTFQSDYFDETWKLSHDSHRNRQLAESSPALAPHSEIYFSPDYAFALSLSKVEQAARCTLGDNFMRVNETHAPLPIEMEFDEQKAAAALAEWGDTLAIRHGFKDWPEGADALFGQNRPADFIFYKIRCAEKSFTVALGQAVTSKRLAGIMPLSAFSLRMEYAAKDMIAGDPELVARIDRACPPLS